MSTPRGLRLIKALQEYSSHADQFHRWDVANVFKKMTLTAAGDGRMRGHFTVDPSMCNSGDTLHGGFISSLVDVIALFGYVSHPKGRVAWTTNLELQYLRKAALGERVSVEAVPLKIHRLGGVMDCELRGGAGGELLARGTSTLATSGRPGTAQDSTVTRNLPFDFENED